MLVMLFLVEFLI